MHPTKPSHGTLSRDALTFAHVLLRKHGHGVAKAIIALALHTKRTRRSACPVMRAGIVRACIGAALRKGLRHHDPRRRAEMTARVVRNAEHWIARERRRFEHRLMRRSSRRKPRSTRDVLRTLFVSACVHADTS